MVIHILLEYHQTQVIHYFEGGSFFFFAAPDGLWHLSFPTSHGIWDPCKWELESQPLDNQEIPREFIISLFLNLCLLAWIKKKKGKKTHKIF